MTTASTRIPPGSDELEFIENTRTGTVHILPWDGTPSEEIPAGEWGDSVVALVMGEEPTARLAGIRGLVGT